MVVFVRPRGLRRRRDAQLAVGVARGRAGVRVVRDRISGVVFDGTARTGGVRGHDAGTRHRLRELGAASGVPAHLVLGPQELKDAWFEGVSTVGLTSGASTPESSVRAVVDHLRGIGATAVQEVDGIPETIEFTLPMQLRT